MVDESEIVQALKGTLKELIDQLKILKNTKPSVKVESLKGTNLQ